MPSAFEELDRGGANYTALTPLSFLAWAARVYPDKTAVIHGARTCTYAELAARARRLGSALARRGQSPHHRPGVLGDDRRGAGAGESADRRDRHRRPTVRGRPPGRRDRVR